MELFLDIYRYFFTAIWLTMAIVAFTWKPRKGKGLLCTFLSLQVAGDLIGYVFIFLNKSDFTSFNFEIFQGCNIFVVVVSSICLLLYIIIRRNPSNTVKSNQHQTDGPNQY